MFEDHKAKKAAKEHEDAVAAWQADREAQADLLEHGQDERRRWRRFNHAESWERLCSPRSRTPRSLRTVGVLGHYQGHSQGVSIPVANFGGRSIRYRVGVNKGHFVPGNTYTHRHRYWDDVHHEPTCDLPRWQADPRVRLRQADRVRARRQLRGRPRSPSPTGRSPRRSTTDRAWRGGSTSGLTSLLPITKEPSMPSLPSYSRDWTNSTSTARQNLPRSLRRIRQQSHLPRRAQWLPQLPRHRYRR